MVNKISYDTEKKINTYKYEFKWYSGIVGKRYINISEKSISISGENYFWYTIKILWKSKIIVKINEYWSEQHIRNPVDKYGSFKNYKEAIGYFLEYKSKLSEDTNFLVEKTQDEVVDALC